MAESLAPPDQESRDRIVQGLDTSMLVEASAGTGKTTCLVDRMVNLLRLGRCRTDTMAAVTFTRKAASELRARFQFALEKGVASAKADQQIRLSEALASIERCFVGTIHSFCARLIRERPVESGVDPGFIELDETADFELRQQAWREHVATLIATDAPLLSELERLGLKISPATTSSSSLATELDELGLEPAELGPAFMKFAEFPDVHHWPAETVELPDLSPCVKALEAYAQHMRSISPPADFGRDKLMPKFDLVQRMVRRKQAELHQPAELMEVLEQFKQLRRREVVQRNWPGGPAQAIAELERWNEFNSQFAVPLLLAWREHRYEPAMRAIRGARDVYDRLRREHGALNFHDLLLISARLLQQRPEIRACFRERVTHLLIDEFQDTDPIQAEVMMLLTADDGSEADWQHCRPRPGSLFVVGDPKQSIYRFRRADILTYEKVRQLIEAAGGQVVSLTANFRSAEPIIDWVNACFSSVFPEKPTIHSPANASLQVGRQQADDANGVRVERLTVPEKIKNNNGLSEYEAELIARSIRQAIDEKHPLRRTDEERARGLPEHAVAGDFLIILRTKARTTTYARALQQYGLPHAVTGGSVLNEVPELELLHLCLSAVERRDDPIALVAVLRSELFGIADTALYEFRRRGGRFHYQSEIPPEMSREEFPELHEAFACLQTYASWLRRMPTIAAIERVASDLGLPARAGAVEEGDFHAGSLLKAIELLRSSDDQLTVGDCVRALGRLVAQEQPHDGVPIRPPREAAVRVMNLHQCKGLEANFVFLAFPSGEKEHAVDLHIDRSSDVPRGYVPIYGLKRSQWGAKPILAQPPGWDKLADEEQRFLDAESDRLLYVAATRACRRMTIARREEAKANGKNPWRRFEPSLESAAEFAPPNTLTAPAPAPLDIDAGDWEQAVRRIDARWHGVLQASYAVQPIKQTQLAGQGLKPRSAERHGAQWGNVLHSLLETLMNRPQDDIRGLALSLLEQENLPLDLASDAIRTAKHVCASELWNRARQSARCLTEVPLAWPTSAAESAGGLPTVTRGVIDLVFAEQDGWVIVDYKTERVDAAELPALVEYYRPQVEAYADAWNQLCAETIVERGILFTHTGSYSILTSPNAAEPNTETG